MYHIYNYIYNIIYMIIYIISQIEQPTKNLFFPQRNKIKYILGVNFYRQVIYHGRQFYSIK